MKQKYRIEVLEEENAKLIAHCWKYPDIYSVYDTRPDMIETYKADKERDRHYFQVRQDDMLVGCFRISEQNNSVVFEAKMRPELCGLGLGRDFLLSIEKFITGKKKYNTMEGLIPWSNQRARTLCYQMGYADCGYVDRYIGRTIVPSVRIMKCL